MGFPHGHVDAAQGRAAVAGDKASGIEAALAVGLPLREHQAHQSLRAGQENAALAAAEVVCELVVQIDVRVDRGGAVHECSFISTMIGARACGFFAL
ncbi:2-oxoacid ferredoxin oxidoreductase domain protein [Bordetella holmesii 44057]|nr:2-oxoacid ferredoxin oxidoreductase domain protein [Bordetella holmesii 44057]